MTIAAGQPATAADVLAAVANAATPIVATIAALRTLAASITATSISVQGYYAAGDNGGGTFIQNASDTTSADNGGIIIVDGTGRRWYRSMASSHSYNVLWFGAKGDGVTNDTARINAAFVYMALVGGTLFFPTGKYVTTTGVTLDLSAVTISQAGHVNITGAGMGSTSIYLNASTGTALTVKGAQPNNLNLFCTIQGIQFVGIQQTITYGLALTDASVVMVRDVYITTFGVGLSGNDVLQSTIENCVIGNCGYGVDVLYNNYSPPNAISFIGCDIVSNLNAGVILNDPTTVNFFGGAIQGNGIGGSDTNRYGVGIFTNRSQALDGAVGATFYGVYFESNAPTCDIWATAGSGTDGPSSVLVSGCVFNRVNSTNFATNNIRCDLAPSNKFKLSLIGCGFNGFGSYVANAGRPYVKLNITAGAIYDIIDQGNIYGSSVEEPKFLGPMKTQYAMASSVCVFDGTVTSPTIIYGYNAGSITRVGVGDYIVTFEVQGPRSTYAALVTTNGAGHGSVFLPSAANVRIQTMDSAGTLTNYSYISLLVFGNGNVA